ncbi:MAG: C25 family cysteine peptidase [Fibrobacter sp.]|nr:C25 family cysteine peptidase [Fibrobacter sp.]
MKILSSYIRFVAAMALLAMPSFAAKIVEDSRTKFILDDEVLESSTHACENGSKKEGRYLPERALYLDDNAVPYRNYFVALPSNNAPSVSVIDLKTVALGKAYCKDVPLNYLPVTASTPVYKDGLWITEVRVPLILQQGASASIRKSFRLRVDFNGTANGVNPGKRALSRVENQAGASRFGVSQTTLRKGLRKAAADQMANVSLLAEFILGDKNIATFSEDGVYAVEYKTIRNALASKLRQGELEGVKVDEICLFGASPDTLADMGPNEALRNPNQLFEMPIEIRDHSSDGSSPDGIFGNGDSLIFVGYGNAFWKRFDKEDPSFVNGKMDYFHSYSPYSYYQHFVFGRKVGGKGLRLKDKLKAPAAFGKNVEWMRYVRAEKDVLLRDTYYGRSLNWESSSGKEWFWLWHDRGEVTEVPSSVLNTSETVNLPGMVKDGRQYVGVTFFPHRSLYAMGEGVNQTPDKRLSSKSYEERMSRIRFAFDVNGASADSSTLTLLPAGNYRVDNPNLKSSGNEYSMTMQKNDRQYDRFDGYTVAYQWNPVVDSAEWLLPGAVSGVIKIPVESGVQVMKFKNYQPMGLLSVTDGFAKDSVSADDDVRYLAYREKAYRSTLDVSGLDKKHENVLSDLTSPNSKLEYLIIAPEELLDGAVALAEFRSGGSAVSTIPTTVVAVEDIYRRYTAGRLSPVAIRNYISYVYSVCPNLKYVLLAGAGNYDYRGSNGKLNRNLVPPFEKESAVTEDFYAALDSGEIVGYGTYDLDVAVGRLPVLDMDEFNNYLEKVKEYEKLGVMDYSDWRSTLLMTADDAKNSGKQDNSKHSEVQEFVANAIDSLAARKKQRWNMKKVYLLDYPEDAAGQKKEAADDFINVLNQGALFATYFGHGSKIEWASEGLLKSSYVARLSNKKRYTILGSFSCTVGRFDEGNTRSLSEEFMVASGVGSIASVGATRETFKDTNRSFALTFMLGALSGDNQYLGDALFKTKLTAGTAYSDTRYEYEKYVLIGEPVIKLPQSTLPVKFDQKIDTLKALDKMKLSGSVDGLRDGFVNLVITEGRTEKRLDLQVTKLVSRDSLPPLEVNDTIDVSYEGNLVFSEEIPVKNGRFETEFITPRKLSFGDTAAEMRAWAYSTNSPVVGRDWKNGIVIAGVSSYADSLKDTVPPTIQIQSCYNDGFATDFYNGQEVKLQSPACLQVVVSDSTALDFREQADEGLSLEILGVLDPFHPSPFLEQNSKRAKVRMNFSSEQYPAGKYLFKVRAQDVLGNSSVKMVNLEITEGMVAGLADVFNAPNPMGKKGTNFYFKNLAVNNSSKVNIFIYNQNGKLVQVLKNVESGVHWNGRDMHGRLLANGLYHYVVRSEVSAAGNSGKKTWTKKQKLLISR